MYVCIFNFTRACIVRRRRRTFVSTTRTGTDTTTSHRPAYLTFCMAISATTTATQLAWLCLTESVPIWKSHSLCRSYSTQCRTTSTGWSACVQPRSLCTSSTERCCITSTTSRAPSTASRWINSDCHVVFKAKLISPVAAHFCVVCDLSVWPVSITFVHRA